jgi:hypothetical protein
MIQPHILQDSNFTPLIRFGTAILSDRTLAAHVPVCAHSASPTGLRAAGRRLVTRNMPALMRQNGRSSTRRPQHLFPIQKSMDGCASVAQLTADGLGWVKRRGLAGGPALRAGGESWRLPRCQWPPAAPQPGQRSCAEPWCIYRGVSRRPLGRRDQAVCPHTV